MDRTVVPARGPLDAVTPVPGSKSETNRAAIVAALAEGTSTLRGVLRSADTDTCVTALEALGVAVERPEPDVVVVTGSGGAFPATEAAVWCEDAGTCARFLPPAVALGEGDFTFDGTEQLRARPLGPTLDALRALGIEIDAEARGLPFSMRARGLEGGWVVVSSDRSSQPLSGLLIAAPGARGRVEIEAPGLVSAAYVAMTIDLMRTFGVEVEHSSPTTFAVEPQRYQGRDLAIEADASAASYFFAAAAVVGGSVTVPNLSFASRQSDVRFARVLEAMGCEVEETTAGIAVRRDPAMPLRGVDVDMNDISDTFMTLACVAPFAVEPVTIRNVAHVRVKESDRIHAVVTNLRALGVDVDERDDGVTVHPSTPRPGRVATFEDHRIAMAFAVVGLAVDGVVITDAECVRKTVPDFFDRWTALEG